MQLDACTNITCTTNQTSHFTKATKAACLASSDTGLEPATYDWDAGVHGVAKGAGANGELYNGMVLPFVNMSLKGWTWYQVRHQHQPQP